MKTLKEITNNWNIPEIGFIRLSNLFNQIKPIVIHPSDNKFYYLEDVDPIKQSFVWNMVFTKKAKKLEKFDTVFSLHTSYPGLWKPSMEEVFAFIQNHPKINETVAVSVEFLDHHESGNGNIGKITLYRKKIKVRIN
jgi:hypothetical protein